MAMFAEIDRKVFDLLPFVLNTVGHFSRQHPMRLPCGNTFHEFLWVSEGQGCFTVAGEVLHLCAGQGLFVRAGVPHGYEGDDFGTRWLTFTGGEGLLSYFGVGDHYIFRAPPFLDRRMEALYAFAAADSNAVSRSAAGYALICELLAATAAGTDHPLARIEQYLLSHYAEPITLDDIAEALGKSRFFLCHYYKEQRGSTIMEELCRIRMEKAKRFLRLCSASVEEVGRMCGFSSAGYFAMRFREYTGLSPLAYRKTHTAPT